MGAVKSEGNHIQEIRIKILNSAKELLAEEGYRKTTIRKIVERSGVLTGSIYYLFKNKEEIFKSMLLELTKDCQRAIKSRCGSESPAKWNLEFWQNIPLFATHIAMDIAPGLFLKAWWSNL